MTDIPEDVMKLAREAVASTWETYPSEFIRDMAKELREGRRNCLSVEIAARALIADRAAQAERMARLEKKLRAACQWYWPEDDTSSEACRDNPREVFEDMPAGDIAAYSCGGVVYTRWFGWLPPADDADSDDEFEVDEETEAAAEAKMNAEIARRTSQEGSEPS